MRRRNVQGLEIVPRVFDLGTVDRGEPSRPMISFSSSIVWRHRMQPAKTQPNAGDRGVGSPGVGGRAGDLGQPPRGRLVRRLDRLLDLVEAFSGGGLVGLIDRAETFLDRFDAAVLRAEELNSGVFERGGIARGAEGGRRFAGQRVQFRQIVGLEP